MDPFVAEIRIVAFNFPPYGWATCDGQIIPITQNTALFSLLGTTYGGDGMSNFALPNFQSRAPVQFGQGPGLSHHYSGDTGGVQTVTLSYPQMPAHTHTAQGTSSAATSNNPSGNTWAAGGRGRPAAYAPPPANAQMSSQALSQTVGGNSAHNNMQPYLGLLFVIALQGVYPVRS